MASSQGSSLKGVSREDDGNTLVIGLDFGTTFTGVAYCDDHRGTEDASLVSVIIDWPGRSRGTSEKVPSRISYGPNPDVDIKWGNLIKPTDTATVHALMKLRLDATLGKAKQLKLLMALLADKLQDLDLDDLESDDDDAPPAYPGKPPVEIVADYLSAVREHVWGVLQRHYSSELFNNLKKVIVVTVPAVWSERAKDLTLRAVSSANWGTDKISLVTEPEAAAIYTLKWITQGAQKSEVSVGDNFVLCDAGGGTVDLISYCITATTPAFSIQEAAIGDGDKCGATYIDKEFLTWLQDLIGKEAYDKIPEAKLRHGSNFMNDFEDFKMDFSGIEEGMELTLPKECGIENDSDKGIEDRVLTITPALMKQFFESCVQRTIELIDEQVKSLKENGKGQPKMVLLVGGFGCNAYLRSRVEEYGTDKGIITRTPPKAWSAVSRGAVCRGLEGPGSGLVSVRLARKHYGTPVSQPWDADIHDYADRYISEYTGLPAAKGQMRWLVEQGEQLPEKTPKTASFSCSANFRKDEDRLFGAVLAGCDVSVAPRRYQDNRVYNICKVTADLSDVPLTKFIKTRTGLKGQEYYVAVFDLVMTFSGGMIEWSFVFDGKSYGSVSVSYDQ